MKLILQHPWRGNEIGDLVEVDEEQGRRLLDAGVGRDREKGEAAKPAASYTGDAAV